MAAVNLKNMEVDALLKLRADVDDQLAERRTQLQEELARLEDLKPGRPNRMGRRGRKARKNARKGRKLPPQYRSKKDAKLTWAGRGATPTWMREEMKGTRLKKEDFRIKS